MQYYKWLAADGPVYGEGTYDLSGAWQPLIGGELVPCAHGYHVLTADQVACWRGDGLIEVEAADVAIVEHDKCVCRTWRLVRRLHWSRADMLACADSDARAARDAARAAGDAWAAAGAAARDAAWAAGAAAGAAAWAAGAAAGAAERARQRAWIEARTGETL